MFDSCDPVDCSLSGFSVHGILQAKILELGAIYYSRDLPNPGFKPASLKSPALADRFFTVELPGKPEQLLPLEKAVTEFPTNTKYTK